MAKTVANVIVGVADIHYNPTAGTAVGGAGWVELGYSEDGITMTYTADVADIEVEEETFPIDRVITKETVEITCNLAENSLVNLNQALAGGVLAGAVITLAAGAVKEIAIKVVGTNLGGGGATTRTVYIPYATAIGAVGQSYKKGEKTIVPVTFQAFKNAFGADVCTITDA
jgi:hypothetical protein